MRAHDLLRYPQKAVLNKLSATNWKVLSLLPWYF